MKKLLLLSALSLGGQSAMAQQLNSTEMMHILQCDDYACFSKIIEPLGYEISMNKETGGYKTYQYKTKVLYKNESNPEMSLPYTVQFTVMMDDKSTTVAHTLGNKEQKELLLTDFKMQGFEYTEATKTKSNFDNSAVIYKSEAHPGWVLKVTNYEKKDRKKTYLEYEFELWRPNENHPSIKDSTGKKDVKNMGG